MHNALVGGTPGYRDLVMEPAVPAEPAGRSEWVARNLLRPTAPLFDEARRIVHEDPRILEAGRARQVWGEVTHTVGKILGPHLSSLATAWVTDHARDETGLQVGATGQAHVTCPEHRTTHEVDVLALRRGSRPRTAGAGVAFIGEAKAGRHVPDQTQLRRLEHIRDLLTAGGHDATGAVLGLFSTGGFAPGLARDAGAAGGRIPLAGLDELYGLASGGPGSGRRGGRR